MNYYRSSRFWFGRTAHNPTKTTPFNGEHMAGPLAMVSLPDAKTGLGSLCTDPSTSTTPASCNP